MRILQRLFAPSVQGLPPLKPAGDFSASAPRQVSVPGGTLQAPGQAVIVSRTLAGGAAAMLQEWSAKVIDVGNSDQIYFAIVRNQAPIQAGSERIAGLQFDAQGKMSLNMQVRSGEIAIVAYNISGMSATIEPSALPGAIAIACEAWWSGILLSSRGGYS